MSQRGLSSGANGELELSYKLIFEYISTMSQSVFTCVSCGAVLQGKFCSACGEKKINSSDFKLSHLLEQGIDVFTHLDSKLFKSVKALLFHPGLLTAEFIRGVRKPYMKPFQVFFLINIFFFFFLGSYDIFHIPAKWFFIEFNYGNGIRQIAERIATEKNLDIIALGQLYDAKVVNSSKLFVILLVPVIALFSWPYGGKQHPQYGKHVIFALYFLSFLMLVMVLYAKILVWLPVRIPPIWFNLPFLVGMIIHVKFAFHRFPNRSGGIGWLGAVSIVAGLVFSIIPYRWLVSWLTLHSI